MKTAVEEPRAERVHVYSGAGAATCRKEIQEAAERVEKGVNHAKAVVAETLDDGAAAARRLLKRGRYAVEDGLEEAAHAIKQHPFRTLAMGFAAGAVLGLILPRFGRK